MSDEVTVDVKSYKKLHNTMPCDPRVMDRLCQALLNKREEWGCPENCPTYKELTRI